MNRFKKYRNFIASVLLAVYAFIATPIQLWHYHNYAVTTSISSLQLDDTQKISVPDSSNKSIEDNCQICSHHYSVYNNDNVNIFKIFNAVINPTESFYTLAIPLAPYFNSTNKGPPAVA